MINKKNILITGGAGFIGSALVRNIIQKTEHSVINVDKGYISKEKLLTLANTMSNNQYGQYLLSHI